MSVASSDTGTTVSMDQPSGVNMVDGGSQDNSPIAATIGAQSQYTTSILSGTDKNSPKGKMPWDWDKYSFLYNAYYELGGFYNGTALYKGKAELDDEFIERRATTHYRNFFRPIIDATFLPVFSANASRKTEVKNRLDEDGTLAPLWNAFLDDVDNKKNHIQKFCKGVVKYSNMLGVSFVIVDNFPEVPVTTLDAKNNRAFPYIFSRLPQQVEPAMLKLDSFCNILEIGFREQPEEVVDPISQQKVLEPRWKLWTQNYSVKMRKKNVNMAGSQVEYVEVPGTKNVYNLGVTPVIAVMSGDVEEDTVLPHPRFYSIARCNLALYNLDSAQMRLVRAQMFCMLVKPSTKDNDPRTPTATGPLRGIDLPPDTPDAKYATPFYLAPPIGPYQELGNTIKTLSDDLYRLAGQEGVIGVAKTGQKSGVAQAYNFQAIEEVLKETAKTAECLERKIAFLFKKYVTSEDFDYDVIYEDSYHPSDKNEDVQLYTDYISANPGHLGRALALEQMTRSVFDDLDDEEVQPVINEIRQTAKDDQKTQYEIPPALTPEEIAAQALQPQAVPPVDPELDNTTQKKITKMPPKRGFSLFRKKQ